MSPTNDPASADDVLARVRRLVRQEAAPAGGPGAEATPGGRLVLTPAHRVEEAQGAEEARAEARPAPVLVLSEALRAAASPSEARAAAPGAALSLDEAALRRLVAEAVREALGSERLLRDLIRREVLLMLEGRGA